MPGATVFRHYELLLLAAAIAALAGLTATIAGAAEQERDQNQGVRRQH